ncbi:uncharacterized protein G2W53_014586 [Senna tora]|uniref:Uncharacterized protein n=1 Tax=Senna tora TaxID=362788 RepID=A0A834WTI6_9FABA|nr:uncharacterized protein G2W53_014586 [Senna tora]
MQNWVESPSLALGGNPQALGYPHFQLLSGLEGLCSHEHPSGPKGQNRSPPSRPVEVCNGICSWCIEHEWGYGWECESLTLKNRIFLGNVGAQSISLTSPSKEPIFPPLKGFGILESSLHRPWSFIENLLAIFIYFEVNDVVPSDSAYHSGRSSQDEGQELGCLGELSSLALPPHPLRRDSDEISEDCVVYGLFLEFFSLYSEIGVLGNPKCPIAY